MTTAIATIVTPDTAAGTHGSSADEVRTAPEIVEATRQTPAPEISVRIFDAEGLWNQAQAGKLANLTACGPVPTAIADSGPQIALSTDGQLRLELKCRPDFSQPLNAVGRDEMQRLIHEKLGRQFNVEGGAVFRESLDNATFQKLASLPLRVETQATVAGAPVVFISDGADEASGDTIVMPMTSPPTMPRDVSSSPAAKQPATVARGFRYLPAESEIRSAEELERHLMEGLTIFKCYLQALLKQSNVALPPESLVIRPEKDAAKKGKGQRHGSAEEDLTMVSPCEAAKDWPIQFTVRNPAALWRQAQAGELTFKNPGPVPDSIGESALRINFTPQGELQLRLNLEGRWGGTLGENGAKHLLDFAQSTLSRETMISGGCLYARAKDGGFERLAALPKPSTAAAVGGKAAALQEMAMHLNEYARDAFHNLRTVYHDFGMRGEDAPKPEPATNSTIEIRSGDAPIRNFEDFKEKLLDCLHLLQAYLLAKAGDIGIEPPREKIVVRPNPQVPERKVAPSMFSMRAMMGMGDRNSELREKIIVEQAPNVTFNDVRGQSGARARVELLAMQIRRPDIYISRWGAEMPQAGLLYGPPGCGKTLIAKALANAAGFAYLSATATDIMSMLWGEDEKNSQALFDIAMEEAENHPSKRAVMFLDEIDGVLLRRDSANSVERRIVSTFLINIDGLKSSGQVFLLGGTNRKHALDDALLSRMRALQIEVPLPSPDGIADIMRYHFGVRQDRVGRVIVDPQVDFDQLAHGLRGASGRNIRDIVNLTLGAKGDSEVLEPGLVLGPVNEDDILRAAKLVTLEGDAHQNDTLEIKGFGK